MTCALPFFFVLFFKLFLLPSPSYFSTTDWQLPDHKVSQLAGIFYNVLFTALQTAWSLCTSSSFSPFAIASRTDSSKDCRIRQCLYTRCVPAVAIKCISFLTCKQSNECFYDAKKKKKRSRKLRLMQRTNDYFALNRRCVSHLAWVPLSVGILGTTSPTVPQHGPAVPEQWQLYSTA